MDDVQGLGNRISTSTRPHLLLRDLLAFIKILNKIR